MRPDTLLRLLPRGSSRLAVRQEAHQDSGGEAGGVGAILRHMSPKPRLYLHPDGKVVSIGFEGEADTLLSLEFGAGVYNEGDYDRGDMLVLRAWVEAVNAVLDPPVEDEEDLGGDLRFWTTLLRLSSSNKSVLAVLQANCMHVIGPYWIMEGDTDYLRDEGVRFTEVAEGAVPTLGGRSVAELCQICRDSFDVDVAREYAQADHRVA